MRRLRTTPEGRSLALRAVEAVEAVDDRFFGLAAERNAAVAALRGLAGKGSEPPGAVVALGGADGVAEDDRW